MKTTSFNSILRIAQPLEIIAEKKTVHDDLMAFVVELPYSVFRDCIKQFRGERIRAGATVRPFTPDAKENLKPLFKVAHNLLFGRIN